MNNHHQRVPGAFLSLSLWSWNVRFAYLLYFDASCHCHNSYSLTAIECVLFMICSGYSVIWRFWDHRYHWIGEIGFHIHIHPTFRRFLQIQPELVEVIQYLANLLLILFSSLVIILSLVLFKYTNTNVFFQLYIHTHCCVLGISHRVIHFKRFIVTTAVRSLCIFSGWNGIRTVQ